MHAVVGYPALVRTTMSSSSTRSLIRRESESSVTASVARYDVWAIPAHQDLAHGRPPVEPYQGRRKLMARPEASLVLLLRPHDTSLPGASRVVHARARPHRALWDFPVGGMCVRCVGSRRHSTRHRRASVAALHMARADASGSDVAGSFRTSTKRLWSCPPTSSKARSGLLLR